MQGDGGPPPPPPPPAPGQLENMRFHGGNVVISPPFPRFYFSQDQDHNDC
jgi:hypothetical protein